MTARRLSGLLTLLVTAHLALVGQGNVCAEHEAAAAGTQAMAMPDHDAAMDRGIDHGDAHVPCGTTSTSRCCDAVMSCSVAATISSREHYPASAALAAATPTSTTTHLVSRARSPEPPPPRA